MKLIKTEDAVGTVLCHDITQIIKGVTKDAVFRKGHVVTEEDIPVLLSVGKEWLYVWEKEEGMLHENDAAEILCTMCLGDHMERSEAKEGKIELTAACSGLLKVNDQALKAVNGFGQMMIASRHGREQDVRKLAENHPKVFVLTGGSCRAEQICGELSGLPVTVFVGENLGSPEERIVTGKPEELAGERFASLAVMWIEEDGQ